MELSPVCQTLFITYFAVFFCFKTTLIFHLPDITLHHASEQDRAACAEYRPQTLCVPILLTIVLQALPAIRFSKKLFRVLLQTLHI